MHLIKPSHSRIHFIARYIFFGNLIVSLAIYGALKTGVLICILEKCEYASCLEIVDIDHDMLKYRTMQLLHTKNKKKSTETNKKCQVPESSVSIPQKAQFRCTQNVAVREGKNIT